ncbi:hypothetical protein ABN028_15930 [Actinopolymorpha sp. B17G11]|uniref:hypothetical protein n=1 Tax=Actinopolymorpha sp. B17G11 TaxID=3160861 RepID=UPI0032E52F78
MIDSELAELARLLRGRNTIDVRIGQLINRPMTSGHAGEWIASRIFDIQLEPSAVARAIDGRFRTGPLAGRSVNVKWYLKRENILDMTESTVVDYYLVLTGPKASAKDAKTLRPWCIDSVYLFDAQKVSAHQRVRGVKSGIAASIPEAQWRAAEIYPNPTCESLPLTIEQRRWVALFAN